MKKTEIEINGEIYVKKKDFTVEKNTEGMIYACVRTQNMGVFFGYIAEEKDLKAGFSVKLLKARRIWYWAGACSLSQLSQEGTKKPEECKFPMEVPEVRLFLVEEIIPASETAKKSLDSVKIWSINEL